MSDTEEYDGMVSRNTYVSFIVTRQAIMEDLSKRQFMQTSNTPVDTATTQTFTNKTLDDTPNTITVEKLHSIVLNSAPASLREGPEISKEESETS